MTSCKWWSNRLCEVRGRRDRLDFTENSLLWAVDWKAEKIKHVDPLNLKWQFPWWPCPGHWDGQGPVGGCSPHVAAPAQGSGSPVLQSCLWEDLCLWAWVSQVRSHIVHPPSSSFFKEEQLVISVLSLQLCDSAARSHWGGHLEDWERCAALNWGFHALWICCSCCTVILCIYCLQKWIDLRTVLSF